MAFMMQRNRQGAEDRKDKEVLLVLGMDARMMRCGQRGSWTKVNDQEIDQNAAQVDWRRAGDFHTGSVWSHKVLEL